MTEGKESSCGLESQKSMDYTLDTNTSADQTLHVLSCMTYTQDFRRKILVSLSARIFPVSNVC